MFQHLKSQDTTIRTAAFYDWWWLETLASRGYPGCVDKDVKYWLDLYPIWDPVVARDVATHLEGVIPSAEKSYTFMYLGNIDRLAFFSRFPFCQTQNEWIPQGPRNGYKTLLLFPHLLIACRLPKIKEDPCSDDSKCPLRHQYHCCSEQSLDSCSTF